MSGVFLCLVSFMCLHAMLSEFCVFGVFLVSALLLEFGEFCVSGRCSLGLPSSVCLLCFLQFVSSVCLLCNL